MTVALPDREWALKVSADRSRLADVRRFVEEVGSEVSLSLERVFDLKVAVSEACANAVEHGGCQAQSLEVVAAVRSRRLTFVVTDSGMFHPPTTCRDGVSSRGLGLPLMVMLMDEVTFCRAPGGGTRVSLSVRLDD
jgi:serine/threonine-protein kinase RsbW